MRYFLSIVGMIFAYFLLIYRERVGDAIGEADWMRRVGGIYYLVIVIALIIFFWSAAELTNTTSFLFGFLRYLIPGLAPEPEPL